MRHIGKNTEGNSCITEAFTPMFDAFFSSGAKILLSGLGWTISPNSLAHLGRSGPHEAAGVAYTSLSRNVTEDGRHCGRMLHAAGHR